MRFPKTVLSTLNADKPNDWPPSKTAGGASHEPSVHRRIPRLLRPVLIACPAVSPSMRKKWTPMMSIRRPLVVRSYKSIAMGKLFGNCPLPLIKTPGIPRGLTTFRVPTKSRRPTRRSSLSHRHFHSDWPIQSSLFLDLRPICCA